MNKRSYKKLAEVEIVKQEKIGDYKVTLETIDWEYDKYSGGRVPCYWILTVSRKGDNGEYVIVHSIDFDAVYEIAPGETRVDNETFDEAVKMFDDIVEEIRLGVEDNFPVEDIDEDIELYGSKVVAEGPTYYKDTVNDKILHDWEDYLDLRYEKLDQSQKDRIKNWNGLTVDQKVKKLKDVGVNVSITDLDKMASEKLKGSFEIYRKSVGYDNMDFLVDDIYSFFEKHKKAPVTVYTDVKENKYGDYVVVTLEGDLKNLVEYFNREYYTTEWSPNDVKREWLDSFHEDLFEYLEA